MVALGLVAGRVPLLEVPGFELAALGALCAAALGAPVGIAASRRQLELPRPSAPRAFARAAAALVALLAILFATATARGAVGSRCSASAGAAFLLVLALPCALLAASLGVFSGILARGRRIAAGLFYVGGALASLALTLRAAYLGPAAYALDHLLGYWPGPLYDEAIRIDERLLLFQVGTFAWTAALVAAAALLPAMRRHGSREPGAARSRWASLAVALAIGASVHGGMAARGDLASRAHVAGALGASRQGARCRIVFPAEKRPEEAERLLRDCELDTTLVTSALEIERPPKVTAYFYRSAAEKRRLVGAGRTDYTKPWLAEVHLVDAPAPHPVLRHELVHALASAFATGPLRVPARAGVLVSAGLVEGLAVAVDLPRGEWTAHEWTRAMRDLGLMPGLAGIIGPAGFFGAPPARAYTVAGSFLAFLLERHGAAPVKRVYGGTTFAQAFGKPLEALAAEWSAFLDGVVVPPALRAAADARFRRESLFARACAREVAGLEARADDLSRSGRPQEAVSLLRRAADLSGDPGDLRAAGDALRRSGDLEAAERAYLDALSRAHGRSALEGALQAVLGDLSWKRGDTAAAAERYRAALMLDPDPTEARLLAAKIAASEDPPLGEATAPWLLQLGDPAIALARVARSNAPLAEYLAGRAFLARGAPRLAERALSRIAKSSGLPGEAFTVEARRLLAEAQCAAGEWDRAAAGFSGLARNARGVAERLRAADAARRCELEREIFGTPVPAPGDLEE